MQDREQAIAYRGRLFPQTANPNNKAGDCFLIRLDRFGSFFLDALQAFVELRVITTHPFEKGSVVLADDEDLQDKNRDIGDEDHLDRRRQSIQAPALLQRGSPFAIVVAIEDAHRSSSLLCESRVLKL